MTTPPWKQNSEASTSPRTKPIEVLQSVRLDPAARSYMNYVADQVNPDVATLVSFDYRRALVGRWDVFHVHWPEELLRRGGRRQKYVAAVLFLALLARIKVQGKPVVRTLHNVEPHDAQNTNELRLLRLLDRLVTVFVKLNPFTPLPRAGASAVVIPHGHYRAQVDTSRLSTARQDGSNTLLYFGYIKPYKDVDRLVRAFAALPDTDVRLNIMGKVAGAAVAEVRDLIAADERIRLTDRYVSDAELEVALHEADLVVLPYASMHNSGAVLRALSSNRPVLVVDNEVNRWLADECGSQWFRLFDAPMTVETLRVATSSSTAGLPRVPPRLEGRGWDSVAEQYEAIYTAVSARR